MDRREVGCFNSYCATSDSNGACELTKCSVETRELQLAVATANSWSYNTSLPGHVAWVGVDNQQLIKERESESELIFLLLLSK